MNWLFILSLTCVVFCVIVFLYLSYHLYIANSSASIGSQWHKIPTLMASFFYCGVSITCLLISMTMDFRQEFDTTNVNGYIFTNVCLLILFLTLSKLSIYVSILSRLYLTFRESAYFMKKCTLNFMIFVLCLFLLCGIYWNALLFTKYRLKSPPASYYIQFEVIFISLIVYDFIASVVMLLLFISKLHKHIFSRQQTMSHRVNKRQSFLDKNDMTFINAITRYTILSSAQIFISQLGLVSLVFAGIYVNWNNHYYGGVEHKRWEQMHYYFFSLIAADILLNSSVLTLYFPFSRSLYYRLCGCEHRVCMRCFVWNADRIIKKHFAANDSHRMLNVEDP